MAQAALSITLQAGSLTLDGAAVYFAYDIRTAAGVISLTGYAVNVGNQQAFFSATLGRAGSTADGFSGGIASATGAGGTVTAQESTGGSSVEPLITIGGSVE
jgi:hypothetical protein